MKIAYRTLKPGDLVSLEIAFNGLIKVKVVGKSPTYFDDRKNGVRVVVTSGAPDYWKGRVVDVPRSVIRFRDLIRVRRGHYYVTPWPFNCEWDEPNVYISCGISDEVHF